MSSNFIPFQQPVLTENGVMGGDSFAVDQEIYYTERTGLERLAFKAFDKTSDRWQANGLSLTKYYWIGWYNPTKLILKSLKVTNAAGQYAVLDYILSASNDNENWEELVTGTNDNVTDSGLWEINLPESVWKSRYGYKYFRLYCKPRTTVSMMIKEIELTAFTYSSEMSDNFRKEAYAQETGVAVITLLTITSDKMDGEIHLCDTPVVRFPEKGDNAYGLVSNDVQYDFIPFNIVLPQDDETGAVTATLEIDNIGRELIGHIRSIKSAINVSIQVILSNNLDYIELEFNDFKLTNVKYNVYKVWGDLSVDYLGQEPFPQSRFTPKDFPGLF